MRIIHLAGALAIAIAGAAAAQADWSPITTAPGGSVYLIDANHISKTDKGYRVWIKGDHSHDATNAARTSMTLIGIDCGASTMKTLSYLTYDSYGKSIVSHNAPDYGSTLGYEPIVPDSMADALYQALCKTKDSTQ